jgi:hypothetical protein
VTTKENDTDPSTPSARRPSDPRALRPIEARAERPTEPRAPGPVAEPLGPTLRSAGSAAPLRVSTDPGMGPAPQPREAPLRPMGIVVPAAVPPGKKDSVEVLLDGMTTPQPPRTKTMPQTDGEASASYHARHDVRAARTSPDDEPKVIVERPGQPPTPLELAATVPELGAERERPANTAERGVREKLAAAARLPTAELPPRLGPKIALAGAAGMLVVLFLFVALAALRANRPSEEQAPSALTAPAEPPAAALSARAPAASAPAATGEAVSLLAAAPVASTAVVKSSPRPAGKARAAPAASTQAPSAAPDLSELKTIFH